MTPERTAALAALEAALALLRKPEDEERVIPLDEACARLGITHEVWRKRHLDREIPVIRFSAQTKGVRVETLNEFIRRREQLARAQLRSVARRTA